MSNHSFNPYADYEFQEIGLYVDANRDTLSPCVDLRKARGEFHYPMLLLHILSMVRYN
jgi:hypothetical protein